MMTGNFASPIMVAAVQVGPIYRDASLYFDGKTTLSGRNCTSRYGR